MDCRQLKEILDAYALGAASPEEAAALEEHVADCLRCWEELSEAQRAAALLALSVPLEEPPETLRQRLLELARREAARQQRRPLLERLRRLWPVGAALLAAASGAALALALFLQTEVSDLRDERESLAQQVRQAEAMAFQQQQMLAVLSAPDVRELRIEPTSPDSRALAVYYWSPSSNKGVILCNNLPPLTEEQVYQVWLMVDGQPVPAGTLDMRGGFGQLHMDLEAMERPPQGIGISIEPASGSDSPSGEMFLYASLPQGH